MCACCGGGPGCGGATAVWLSADWGAGSVPRGVTSTPQPVFTESNGWRFGVRSGWIRSYVKAREISIIKMIRFDYVE